ncbi:isoprenylcysteine carboxyl methyltransferase family protein [Fictibacillus iocasae]|uniref:Isoprenylcysteine carboxyl methyltransferase family protein n=1 Tax=Fictibacillus iocasae TaxID=2715437 RepID=A0ABW2NL56_9BACL
MTVFYLFFGFLVFQRIGELIIAKRNEKLLKREGAVEFGASHYPFIVGLHIMFFVSLLIEVAILGGGIHPFWPVILGLFLFVQGLRVWALLSLGKYWNTKILLVPGANVIAKGPYRFLRHPNYLVVILELLLVPLLFNAYVTALLFSALNVWMLSIRIPAEEYALKEFTDYDSRHGSNSRFMPGAGRK